MAKHLYRENNPHFSEAVWIGFPGRVSSWRNLETIFPAPFFRSEFEWDGTEKATVAVACGGYFELYLNGKKVGDHVLDPAPSNFDKHVFYVLQELNEHLVPGKNQIGVILGNSTYNCSCAGPWMLDKIPWRDYPKFLLQVNSNGKCLLASSRKWQCFGEGPLRMDSVKNGNLYDARIEMPWKLIEGWENASLIHGPGGELLEQNFPPCRVFRTIPCELSPENFCDVGENIVGWARIKVIGERGAEIVLRYAEMLDEDAMPTQSNVNAFVRSGEFQTDRYILKGGAEECWEPRFTFHGFRYITVEISGVATITSIEARVAGTDFESVGTLDSPNEILNSLQRNTLRSYRGNFVGFPMDCPTREKQGWTGDALCSAELGLYNFDSASAYTAWIQTLADTQRPNGQLAAKAPLSSGGYNWGYGPAWDSALILIPAKIHAFTGDECAIRRFYDNMRLYLDFCSDMSEDNIPLFGLGDWCHPDGDFAVNPQELIPTAYYYVSVKTVSYFSSLLGLENEHRAYNELASEIKKAFQRHFQNGFDYGDGSQSALATALYFGLAGNIEETVKLLREKVIAVKHSAQFGIQGAQFVPRVLAEYGYIDDALKIFLQKEYPGWVWQLNQGATTLWEYWHGRNSRNHVMFGDLSAWLYRYPAGIRFGEVPGVPVLQPCFPKELPSFHASHRGVVSEWKRINGKIRYTAIIPVGIKTCLRLPGMDELTLENGKYEFEI